MCVFTNCIAYHNLFILLFFLAVSMLKRERPRSPPTNSLSMDYQTADSESVLKRPRPFGISDGVLTAACSFFSLSSQLFLEVTTFFEHFTG